MNKKEFLEALVEELRYLPAKQVNEVLKHYRDKIDVEIDYGTPEEKVIESMKSPEEIAANIYKMHGVNYLEKRKKNVKFKNVCISVLCGILILACLMVFVVGSIFIFRIVGNMASLIIHSFTFNSVMDIILTDIAMLGYIIVMIIAYIYVFDLFIILINELFTKILNAYEKTRGKIYPFMEFTFTNYFNTITKKPKFLLKVLGGCAVIFLIFGISSYATKGYFYRSINDVTNKREIIEINESFDQIKLNANEINVIIKVDKTITKPMLECDYEFDKVDYTTNDNKIIITTKNKKIFDILNVIKSPTTQVTIKVPSNYDITELNLNIDYGKIVVEDLTISNLKVDMVNGNVAAIRNKVEEMNLNLYSGNVVTSLNKIDTMKIKQQSGALSSTEDEITKLDHATSSTNIKIVKTTIDDYKLVNTSGTIYFEKVKGTKLNFLSNTSVNELYDLNYNDAKCQIQNTGNLKITRSKFGELEVVSQGNSYQTLEYIKATTIKISGVGGLMVCEKINENYTKEEIDKLNDYSNYGQEYNEIAVEETTIVVTSQKANFTFNDSKVKNFELNMDSASTAITDITTSYSKLVFKDVGAEITDLMAPTVDIKITSKNLASPSVIKYIYNKNVKVEVNVDMDGKSQFQHTNDNENFIYNEVK